MIGLRQLTHDDVHSWADAPAAAPPRITGRKLPYNIATDCLSAPAGRVALIDGDGTTSRPWTFGELSDAVARFATVLVRHGVTPGDRVAVRLSQSAAMAIAVLGTMHAGGIAVTISGVLGGEAAAHRLDDSGARILVGAGSDMDRALAERAGVPMLAAPDDAALAAVAPAREAVPTTADDPALLLYTSGTTGSSKGVLHAHRVLLGHHPLDLAWDRVRSGDVAYSPVDWTWAGGLFLGLLAPLAYGMTVVAFREHHFDPQRTIALMRDTGVSVGLFPPTALRTLQRSGAMTGKAVATLRLRALITGAEAVEGELVSWARDELDLSINNAFGQTEANALIGHSHALGDLPADVLGRPYPGRRVAALDPEHHPLPAGQLGEIAVAADDPVCLLRYWNNPAATAATLTDGWLLTGDMGRITADGTVHFQGRSDDLIKSGGYRVGPAEIEAALFTHPDVRQCAAVGVPDPVRGQRIVAFVVLAAGHSGDSGLTADLQDRVRAQVGAHAYPRDIEYVDALATTSAGKVDHRALRVRAADGVRERRQ